MQNYVNSGEINIKIPVFELMGAKKMVNLRVMQRKIHIVAFQNPFPPTYGGVIDIYYKLRELKRAGWYVVLHAYYYGDRAADCAGLGDVADEIYFYRRHTGVWSAISRLPYMVNSRRSDELVGRLAADDAPILFEGLHCCAIIANERLKGRVKLLRAHNVEHEYYRGLAASEHNLFRRMYYSREARRLERFEPRAVGEATAVAAVSQADADHFRERYPGVPVVEVPCFFDADTPSDRPARERFVLYNANLSVAENEAAALRIVERIASLLPDEKFVIAGMNPSQRLAAAVARQGNVVLKPNLTAAEMEDLQLRAKVTLLITDVEAGIKLKLLGALVRGDVLVVNPPMLAGTTLATECLVGTTDKELAQAIVAGFDMSERQRNLPAGYNPQQVVKTLEKVLSACQNT